MTVGLGIQLAALNLAAIMLIPTVVMRAAGQPEGLCHLGGARIGRHMRRNDRAAGGAFTAESEPATCW